MPATATKSPAVLSSAAHKAWATRRAKALAAAGPVMVAPAVIVPGIKLPPVDKPVVLIVDDKAWMTPRTAAQANVPASARDVFEPAADFQMVEMYVDDAAIGCGFRRFVVLEQSDRHVRLFSVPSLTAITVGRAHFERRARDVRAKRAKLATILLASVAAAERANDRAQAEIIKYSGAHADRALALIQG